jgi:hypothetical protein
MFSQTDQERERYEARRKAQLDHNTVMKVARMEGTMARMEGTIAMIHFCEKLLNRSETPSEQLAHMPLENLAGLAEDLQTQLLKERGNPK